MADVDRQADEQTEKCRSAEQKAEQQVAGKGAEVVAYVSRDTAHACFAEKPLRPAKLQDALGDSVVGGVVVVVAADQAGDEPVSYTHLDVYKRQRLEKRIDDLKRAQMIAMQTAPEIRLLQNNSRMLIAKFQDIVAVTIPAWKKQFSLHILMEEQAKSAALVTAIDDATNAALRKNADLLRQNLSLIHI